MSQMRELSTISDPLADALGALRIDGMFYCPSELTSPWGVDLPDMDDWLWFHVITSGSCTVRDASGETHDLCAGDVVLVPHGGGHVAYDDPNAAAPTVFDLPHEYFSDQYAVLRHGGGGDLTTLICGVVRFGHPAARNLLELLPELIIIRSTVNNEQWAWFPAVLELLDSETRVPKPGGEAIVTRLCDIIVMQAIRSWIQNESNGRTGWIGALRDPEIGRALALVHRDPARKWTVDTLASEVAMSRSGFSARFTELVGESPKHYVTRWRMQVAEAQLQDAGRSILEIAHSLGYSSEAAFSRAFKRVMGMPPSQARTMN